LWKLDPNRKRSLMQFLHEAKLIRREELDQQGEEVENPVIGLSGADLRDGYLRGLNLSKADLRGADLKSVNLRNADLKSADLRGANVKGADLSGAYLKGALLDDGQLDECKSLAGATIPGVSSE
jgi:uncharacterized protein YjbI with pentapeptide repeats